MTTRVRVPLDPVVQLVDVAAVVRTVGLIGRFGDIEPSLVTLAGRVPTSRVAAPGAGGGPILKEARSTCGFPAEEPAMGRSQFNDFQAGQGR